VNLLRATHLLMFVSGALALVYEILWMRRFTAVFGASTPAVAVTLAAMFLGMGLGSAVIGTRAGRTKRLLRAYGLLEIGIAVGALLVEPILMFYARTGSGLLIVKTGVAVGALLLPSFCMGGTIPLLGHVIAAESRRLGIKVGGLYAANLFGATVGAFSVPFLWLPNLTARAAYGVCMGFSVIVGVAALLLDQPTARSVEATKPKEPSVQAVSWPIVLTFSALSGIALFTLQILWSRMFAQIHENSIYSFSIVLGVLLIGLGVGAEATKLLLQCGFAPRRLLAIAWVGSGLVICFTPLLFYNLTDGLSLIEGGWGGGSNYALKLLGLTLPTVLLPTALAGMVLPLLLEMAGAFTQKSAGKIVGTVLAVNTAGSVVGSLAAAFLLPKAFGMWSGLFAVGALMIVVGGFCLRRAFAGVALLVVLVLMAFIRPSEVPRTKGENVIAITEGNHGIVAVLERGNSRRMKLNNSYILGGSASTGDERLQAHIPLLIHPAPRKVAFLGFGTGITAGGALLHPVDTIAAVDLVPEVIAIAASHFAAENLSVCNSPRARIVADDARSFLRSSREKFDVIVADLFVPWHQGEALLYTSDQFEAARSRLNPGGVFCQWLPMFQLSQDQFNMVAATFLDVFPNATLWRGDFSPHQPAVALIAHPTLDVSVIDRRLHELQPDPANRILKHQAGFWMFYVGALDPSTPQFRSARRNRENQPWLEILGPRDRAGTKSGGFAASDLEGFLVQIQNAPQPAKPFTGLGPNHLRWQQAGANIARGSRSLSSGQKREGAKVIQDAIASLPAEVQDAFGNP
jgi:spermidine synthase